MAVKKIPAVKKKAATKSTTAPKKVAGPWGPPTVEMTLTSVPTPKQWLVGKKSAAEKVVVPEKPLRTEPYDIHFSLPADDARRLATYASTRLNITLPQKLDVEMPSDIILRLVYSSLLDQDINI